MTKLFKDILESSSHDMDYEVLHEGVGINGLILREATYTIIEILINTLCFLTSLKY
jgi:hypothetical protein